MADKTTKKKKAFQDFCRSQVKSGLINDADGIWKSPRECYKVPLNDESAMVRSMRKGYKL